jgi:hypothetical protein
MPNRTLRIDYLAQALMDSMPEKGRQRILRAVKKLLPLDPEDWPADKVVRLKDEGPLYLLRVPPDLYAFFTPEDNVLVLRDVSNEEIIRTLSGSRKGTEG